MLLHRVGLVVFLVLQFVFYSVNAQSDTLFCYKTNVPISVNGILSEWDEIKGVSYDGNKTISRGRSDNFATTKFTWDYEKLYIAFRIKDEDLISENIDNDTNIWDDDCIEVYLSTNPESKTFLGLSQNEYHFLVNLNNTKGTFKGEMHHFLNRDNREGILNWDADILSGVKTNGSLNDSFNIDSGYVIEIAIYWESLNIKPKNGTVISIDFCVEDNDYNKPLGYFDYAGLEQLFARPLLWKKMVLKDSDVNSKQVNLKKSTYHIKFLIGFLLIFCVLFVFILLKKTKKDNLELDLIDVKVTSTYHQEKAKKIVYIIKKEYADSSLTANNIADAVNISERHLRRVLKDVYNKSFTEILSEYRAKKGAYLLLNTLNTITEISFEVGCNSLVQFTRIFKKEFDLTPSDYRKKEKNK